MYSFSRFVTTTICETGYGIANLISGIQNVVLDTCQSITNGVTDQRSVYRTSRRYR